MIGTCCTDEKLAGVQRMLQHYLYSGDWTLPVQYCHSRLDLYDDDDYDTRWLRDLDFWPFQ